MSRGVPAQVSRGVLAQVSRRAPAQVSRRVPAQVSRQLIDEAAAGVTATCWLGDAEGGSDPWGTECVNAEMHYYKARGWCQVSQPQHY